jgi:PAS domain S-box-containing protein
VTLNAAEALLVVSVGACAYLAALQLWLGFRVEGPSRWAGAWSVFAVLFSGARFAQLLTDDPSVAVVAARLQIGATPFLMWTMCRLVGSVCGGRPLAELRIAAAATLTTSAAMLFTPWFTRPEVRLERDLVGEPFLSAVPGPGMWFAGVLTAFAITWCLGTLTRARQLDAVERRTLLATLSIYAVMGVSSLLQALSLVQTQGVLEYGPLVVSIGAGRVLAARQRRLETELQAQIDERARALRESEARYRDVLENAPIGFLTMDAEGKLEHANAALLAMLGSTRAQFEQAFNVVTEANARKSGFSEMLLRSLHSGEFLEGDFEFDTWWGRRLSTHTSVAPRRDARGAISGALAIVEDNTERRAIERQLQRAQRTEAVGQLAAGIAHEINNPMAYVRSNLTVLGEELDALEKEARQRGADDAALARIAALGALRARSLESVQRTVSVVRDLREFSRSGAAERELTDVNALLEHAARLASTRRAGGREIELRTGAAQRVLVAPGQLRQVLLNLLVHALEAAGPNGHVSATSSSSRDEVLVAVHDDGTPIPAAERARLFEPFGVTRGASEPSLGLYTSQQIVREHGGVIEVLSNERGTTFVVRLPAAPEENPPRG